MSEANISAARRSATAGCNTIRQEPSAPMLRAMRRTSALVISPRTKRIWPVFMTWVTDLTRASLQVKAAMAMTM